MMKLIWLFLGSCAACAAHAGPNLISNGTFDTNLAGWTPNEGNSVWVADGGPTSGSGSSSVLTNPVPSNSGLIESSATQFELLYQCIAVEPGTRYSLSATARAGDVHDATASPMLLVVPVVPLGGNCNNADHQVSLSFPNGTAPADKLTWPLEPTAWTFREGAIMIPSDDSVDEVRVSLSIDRLFFSENTGYVTGLAQMLFDDVRFARIPTELAVDIGAIAPAGPGDTTTIPVTVTANDNPAKQIDLRLDHPEILRYTAENCPGEMSNSQSGNDDFVRWFNIPDLALGQTIECEITVEMDAPLDSTVFDIEFTGTCNDCAVTSNTADVTVLPRADIAVELQTQLYQSRQKPMVVDVQISNEGTGPWDGPVNIFFDPDLAVNTNICGQPVLVEPEPGVGTLMVNLLPGQAIGCQLEFDSTSAASDQEVGISALIQSSEDFDLTNNSDSVDVTLVDLTVTETLDRSDNNPGDGICRSNSPSSPFALCSLRAAIEEANALAGFQIVVLPFDASDYELTSGAGHLAISESVEIRGIPGLALPGSTALPRITAAWADAADRSRVMVLATSGGEVSMKKLEIVGQDWLQAGDGGLIFAFDTPLDMDQVILREGAANGRGGALWTDSNVQMENVIVRDNRAVFGAGIAVEPADPATMIDIRNSRITGNDRPALTAAQSQGGGLWQNGGNLVVSLSTIDANFTGRGGGLALIDTVALIENSTVSGNTVDFEGGGFWLDDSNITVDFSTIAFNEAAPGNNNAGEGGGFYVRANAAATVSNSILLGNQAQTAGSLPVIFPKASTCFGALSSDGYNSIQPSASFDADCNMPYTTGDQSATPSSLAPLAPASVSSLEVPFHALTAEGSDVDEAHPGCFAPDGLPRATSQQGPRPLDGDSDGSTICDKGSAESLGSFPALAVACPSAVSVSAGSFATISCSVSSINGLAGDVFFACVGTPPSCDFVPEPVTLAADTTQSFDVIVYGNATQSPVAIDVLAQASPAQARAAVEVTTTGDLDGPDLVDFSGSISGNARLTSSPAGMDCASDCVATFASGANTVRITADPEPGWQIVEWTGACASIADFLPDGRSECELSTATDQSFGVIAEQVSSATLEVEVGANGRVQSNPNGIDCPGDCSESYAVGTTITLTAVPDSFFEFSGWSGACSGTGECQVAMDQEREVTAEFDLATPTLTVELTGSGSGRVISAPAGIDCPDTCSAELSAGLNVELSAIPDAGSNFQHWTGACSGSDSCSVTMDASVTVGAVWADSDVVFSDGWE